MNKHQKSGESITSAKKYINYIISQRHIRLPTIPDSCFITHSASLLEIVKARYQYNVIDIGSCRPVEVFFFYPEKGRPFSGVISQPGAPMAAVMLEELIALGFQRFFAAGSAGHPAVAEDAYLQVGDLVLADRALVYEGTSAHYGNNEKIALPDSPLLEVLQTCLEKRNHSFHKGSIATTDALYRETPCFIAEISQQQAIGIDMELSALFTVSRFYHKEIAALLYISDIVSVDQAWDIGLAKEAIDKAERNIIEVLLDFINI